MMNGKNNDGLFGIDSIKYPVSTFYQFPYSIHIKFRNYLSG